MSPLRRPSASTTAAAGDAIPFEHEGRVHLFYLSSPSGTTDYPERVRTTWQHAVTDDLVEWEELPAAVAPSDDGGYDGGGIWTGSVVEKDGVFHLFYTGHHVGATNPQTICLATSTDLITFEKHDGNPILLPTDGCEPIDWRDPYVFYNEDEGQWWMLIAARLADGPVGCRGCIMLATSDDLLAWTVESDPFYAPGTTYCPECPELWQDGGGRWHLVYSRFSEEVGTVSRVADHPRGPFREPARPDLGGRRWYAAKSAPDPNGDGRIFFGWIHDRVVDERGPRWLWGGDFALPRRARAAKDGSLDFTPAALPRSSVLISTSGALDGTGGSAHEVLLPNAPARFLAHVTFDPEPAAVIFALELADAGGSGWRFDVVTATGEVRLRRQPTPMDDFWADLTGRGPEYREIDGETVARARIEPVVRGVDLLLVIDGDLVELYVNEQAALTHRIQTTPDAGLGIVAVDGEGRFTAAIHGIT